MFYVCFKNNDVFQCLTTYLRDSGNNNLFFMGVTLGLSSLREERRLRVFENRVLRRIFGPKRDEVTWE